ncbi:MAG: hypothetical protein ACKVOW_14150 [Chitinophagaceae bacterium]
MKTPIILFSRFTKNKILFFLIGILPGALLAQNPNFEPGVQKIYSIAGRDWLIWVPTDITVKHILLVSTTGNSCNTYVDAINQGPAKEIFNTTTGVHRDKFVVATMIRKPSENNSVSPMGDINAGLDIIFQYGASFIYTTDNTSFFTGLSQGAQEMYRYLSNWCTVFGIGCTTVHRSKFRGQVEVIPGAFDPQLYTTFTPKYNWISWGTADPLAIQAQAAFNYFNPLFPAPKTKSSIFVGVGHSVSISDAIWNSTGTTANDNVWLWMCNEWYGQELKISLKTYLQGAYNTGTGLMNDNLRASNLIPMTEPYTGMTNFTHTGGGGGETVPATAFAATGTPANDIVDWVFVQLHNGTTGTVVATKSALLQRDGDIVTIAPTGIVNNYLGFGGFTNGNYYISVRHRNHLGIRTASTIALSTTSVPAYNFTTSLSQAFAGSVSNNPMATISTGVYGMWGGNVNGNANVKYSNPANDETELLNAILGGNKTTVIINVYNRGDLNMDGVVKYYNPGNDETFLLNTVLGGDKTRVISQPF